MGCEIVKTPGGGAAIVCSRGERRRKCRGCARHNATALCDWPLEGKECRACVGIGRFTPDTPTGEAAPDVVCGDCGGSGVATCSAPVCAPCRRVKAEGGRSLDVCPACAVYAFRDERRPVLRDTQECAGCPARVLWALHPGTGKAAPIAAPPDDKTGNVRVWHALGRWRYEALGKAAAEKARESGERLFLNHFADCVEAPRFKRARV